MTALKTLLARLERAGPEMKKRVLGATSDADVRAFEEEWNWQAHDGQGEPPADGPDWRVWMIVAGRGFGKTQAGAEWVWARARENAGARIALVGGSLDEVAKVMVEGESGLLAAARTGEHVRWRAARGELVFPGGAVAQAFSGANPGKLRGPQHHFAWCDELAKWRHPAATWHNLNMGMRMGERPRLVVTTTPAPTPLLGAIAARADTIVSRGRTADNAHLPKAFVAAMTEQYGGTRLGRQELDGEMFEDVEGALWTRELIEQARVTLAGIQGFFKRVVIGVDPPASATGDACGIVVCGRGPNDVGYVLADCSVAGERPDGWARAVARAAEAWEADRVIAECNNGGEMVEDILRGAAPGLPVKLVRASRGKIARAEPVAAAFEAGKARLAGQFPELEDELAYMTAGGYRGAGSPDRADAMVWALTELVVKARPEPHVRSF